MILFGVFRLKKILGVLFVVLGVCFLCIGGFDFFFDNVKPVSSVAIEPGYIIVVDAGHGEPDGGAVSNGGLKESDLNLDIALILEELLVDAGYDVVMTREDENNIADSDKQGTIKSIKVSDLSNRVEIINGSNADMLVSIHMNKFSESSSWGWQSFYKKGSDVSKVLAEIIQRSISECIDRPNKRVALPISNIKIIDEAQIPAVIVECGFLSNNEDLSLLQTDEYREQIARGILNGIENFYEFMCESSRR